MTKVAMTCGSCNKPIANVENAVYRAFCIECVAKEPTDESGKPPRDYERLTLFLYSVLEGQGPTLARLSKTCFVLFGWDNERTEAAVKEAEHRGLLTRDVVQAAYSQPAVTADEPPQIG